MIDVMMVMMDHDGSVVIVFLSLQNLADTTSNVKSSLLPSILHSLTDEVRRILLLLSAGNHQLVC